MYLGSLGLAPALPAGLAASGAAGLVAFRRWPLAILVLLAGLAGSSGAWRYQDASYRDSPDQVAHYTGRSGVAVGVVDSEPQSAGHGVNLTVRIESLTLNGFARPVQGRVLVHYAGAQDVAYGDRISLTGKLTLPLNLSGFDYRAYLAHLGIRATLDYPLLSIQEHSQGNPLEGLAYRLRDAIRRAIRGMLPQEAAALLIGILLGAPTRSLGSLTAPFVSTGMIHIVAISGLKVALVAGVFSRCSATLPLRIRWVAPLIAVSAYTLISGATPSGLRSALMWMLALAALQLGRQSYVWVSLAVVAAGMAFWNPELLWDTGFRLSVMGTAGIVAFSGRLEHVLHHLPRILRESVAVTLAAQIATVPITASGFGQISLVGPLANGLLLPLLGPIMGLGGFAALVAVLSPPAGHVLAFVVFPLLMLFVGVVRALSVLPLAAWSTPSVVAGFALGYYALLIVVALRKSKVELPALSGAKLFSEAWHTVPRGLAAGCVVVAITAPVALSRPPEQPQLTVAGSGGDTVELIQGSRQEAILVDGGALPVPLQTLLGRHLPFWQRGLSAVFVSEPDIAHLGGLAGVASLYDVGEAFDAGAIYPSAAYAAWRAEVRDARLNRLQVTLGRRIGFGEGIAVDVLQPVALSLDNDPAPVAYYLRVGTLTALVLNREAVVAEPTKLVADGRCIDILILPARMDVDSALAVARYLHPRTVVLPQAGKGRSGPTASQLQATLPGARVWTAAEGSELTLSASDGRCAGV